ncbi:hypothetical protein FHS85_001508 [Rhodoligotrophos appendicifer]
MGLDFLFSEITELVAQCKFGIARTPTSWAAPS